MALAPPTGAHVLHQEMSWNLVPLWFNSPGYATAVNSHFYMFERGTVPLVLPPLAPMSSTRKYVRHVCPSSPKILGTPLKSAHVLIFQSGVGASAPCPRPRAPMSPTRKCLGHLCPSGSNFVATPLQSTAIFIFLRWGPVPLVPFPLWPPCPPQENV